MARIHITDLWKLLREHTPWEAEQLQPPEDLAEISLAGDLPRTAEVVEPSLVNKTITYEAPTATVVLDFDERGYLVNIEFV